VTTVELIVAIVGAVAAVAALWGVFTRFRPRFEARVDERRQAIRLDVANKGRASGRIGDVTVVDGELVGLPCAFAGLSDGYYAAEIDGRSNWFLIIEAIREEGPFPEDAQVRVEWGRGPAKLIAVTQEKDTAYFGMKSKWPPP
jgi:hypothetical protein